MMILVHPHLDFGEYVVGVVHYPRQPILDLHDGVVPASILIEVIPDGDDYRPYITNCVEPTNDSDGRDGFA